jgi:outer membrane protein OmpA-like peptidoglycan-associated protein
MNSIKLTFLTGGFALISLLSACAAPMAPTQAVRDPKMPDPGADKVYQVKFPDPGHGVARYIGITIGDDVAKQCGVVQTHFEFDSAEPVPQDQIVLKAFAECLNQPKLSDITLSLVGRADGRGTDTYNNALGLRRATRVKDLLVKSGMSADRIKTSSRGDHGAIGDDTAVSFGYDRRVDAVENGVVHAPR